MHKAAPLLLLGLLAGCSLLAPAPSTPGVSYSRVAFSALPGWDSDRITEALPALQASCNRLLKLPAERSLGADGRMGRAADWQPFCRQLATTTDEAGLRQLLTTALQPWAVQEGGTSTGLFTGYYESTLHGSLTRHGLYTIPLYQRPADLVMVDLGEFRDELKGQRIAGKVVDGKLKPYADRAAIVASGAGLQGSELVWLNSAVDAFFVQVQGSGRVQLDSGAELRIGYDGQNGHIYTAIGKELIRRGALTKETVSMQSIRAWLEANPADADAVMNTNRSYVFFRPLEGNAGPEGAASVALTAQRSLAVDNRYIGYHVPVWINLADTPTGVMRRLVVAQDTGGAIRGGVRGDFFWGHGPEAEHNAGLMKATGRYFVLLPQQLQPQ